MQFHSLQLAASPFNSILVGNKVIESRLYDEKRRLIQPGDILTFTNRESPDQTVEVNVLGLLRYASFHDLFKHNDPAKFGGESVEWLEQQISEFYTEEDQQRYGVVGIEFEVVA